MVLYELDDIEKEALLNVVVDRARAALNDGRPLTEMRAQRPGEKAHEASVLGGEAGDPHGEGGEK